MEVLNRVTKNIELIRESTEESVDRLAAIAIEDSSTYSQAIKKLEECRWEQYDQLSLALINRTIKVVEKQALDQEL